MRSYDQVNVVRYKRVVACVLRCAGVCLCCAAVRLCRTELLDVMRAGSVARRVSRSSSCPCMCATRTGVQEFSCCTCVCHVRV